MIHQLYETALARQKFAAKYKAKREAALGYYMPAGFVPLPGGLNGEPAAYCIEQHEHTLVVHIIEPRTRALDRKAPLNTPFNVLWRSTKHRVNADKVMLRGATYIVTNKKWLTPEIKVEAA